MMGFDLGSRHENHRVKAGGERGIRTHGTSATFTIIHKALFYWLLTSLNISET